MFDWSNASEQDVREELIAPLLAKLGYARGTTNDIIREQTLSYDASSLGRRKKSDPKLVGRADYVLKVLGECRWVIEAKPPNEEITAATVAQALSYARHPEVSGVYAVICNGHSIVVYGMSQSNEDEPLVRVAVKTLDQVYDSVAGVLAPNVVKRDNKRPVLIAKRPLGKGLRSKEVIRGGLVRCLNARWESSHRIEEPFLSKLDKLLNVLAEHQSDITGGEVWRTDDGTIVASFIWTAPHQLILDHAAKKGLLEVKYVCLDQEISFDPEQPSVFDFVHDVSYEAGEEVYDMIEWRANIVETPSRMQMRGQALGVFNEGMFLGFFNSEYYITIESLSDFAISFMIEGTFEIELVD